MILEQAIREKIYKLAKEKDITINKVSSLAGIPHTTLLTFMNNETHDPRISTLLHICEGFNITLGEFFSDEIFDTAEQESNKD